MSGLKSCAQENITYFLNATLITLADWTSALSDKYLQYSPIQPYLVGLKSLLFKNRIAQSIPHPLHLHKGLGNLGQETIIQVPKATQRVHFLDLPLDIRLIIYEEYLDDHSHPPAKILHEEPLSVSLLHWQPAILTVNRQMNDDVMYLFRTRTTFTHRITWQESDYDGFTKSSILARAKGPAYSDMQHLRIEIYPPHSDRPSDMMHILRNVEDICRRIKCSKPLQDLAINFLENEVASWSHEGIARDSVSIHWYEEGENSDITCIFDHFREITRVAKIAVNLPETLQADGELQWERKDLEEKMMGAYVNEDGWPTTNYNGDPNHSGAETRSATDEAELRLKETTGKMSRAKIEYLCENGLRKITPQQLQRLKVIWPYTEALADRDYFPDHKYTGLAPTISLETSSVLPCTCPWRVPTDMYRRRIALLRLTTDPDWCLCPRLRHEVSQVLRGMSMCGDTMPGERHVRHLWKLGDDNGP